MTFTNKLQYNLVLLNSLSSKHNINQLVNTISRLKIKCKFLKKCNISGYCKTNILLFHQIKTLLFHQEKNKKLPIDLLINEIKISAQKSNGRVQRSTASNPAFILPEQTAVMRCQYVKNENENSKGIITHKECQKPFLSHS